MNISEKVAVITGGASGLGWAAANYLVKEQGAKVAIWDLNADVSNTAIQELGEANAIFCQTDVTEQDSVSRSLAQTLAQLGGVHILINAAAIPLSFKVLDREGQSAGIDKFIKVINTNLVGTFNVISQCVEKMAVNTWENGERGVVINTSSISAFEGQIGTSAYAASKAGINGMNMPIARELGPIGIRINSIAPGLFNTPMFKQIEPTVKDKLTQICEAPSRLGDPREYAHACAFIIENGYMNGRVLRLDAATLMHDPK